MTWGDAIKVRFRIPRKRPQFAMLLPRSESEKRLQVLWANIKQNPTCSRSQKLWKMRSWRPGPIGPGRSSLSDSLRKVMQGSPMISSSGYDRKTTARWALCKFKLLSNTAVLICRTITYCWPQELVFGSKGRPKGKVKEIGRFAWRGQGLD